MQRFYGVLQPHSEQYVNQLSFISAIQRIYHVRTQADKLVLFLAQDRVIVQYCYLLHPESDSCFTGRAQILGSKSWLVNFPSAHKLHHNSQSGVRPSFVSFSIRWGHCHI